MASSFRSDSDTSGGTGAEASWCCSACTYEHAGAEVRYLACAVCAAPRANDPWRCTTTAAPENTLPASYTAMVPNGVLSALPAQRAPTAGRNTASTGSGAATAGAAAAVGGIDEDGTSGRVVTQTRRPADVAIAVGSLARGSNDAARKRRRTAAANHAAAAAAIPTPPASSGSLAPVANPNVPGLFLIESFLSPDEELALVAELDASRVPRWKVSTFNGVCFGMRWGVITDLGARTVRRPDVATGEAALPSPATSELGKVIAKIAAVDVGKLARMQRRIDGKPVWTPNECNANDYYRKKGHELRAREDSRTPAPGWFCSVLVAPFRPRPGRIRSAFHCLPALPALQ